MPFNELLMYLGSKGDSIHRRLGTEVVTTKGHRYIESKEGKYFYNNRWYQKTIWCRV